MISLIKKKSNKKRTGIFNYWRNRLVNILISNRAITLLIS
jgi:hypothetical protein